MTRIAWCLARRTRWQAIARKEFIGAVSVAAATLLAVVVIAVRLSAPVSPIDTDIMALVPQDQRDPVLAASIGQAASLVGSRLGLLVRHEDPRQRAAAAADLRAALVATGLFIAAEDEAEALARYLFAHRDQLLCPPDRALLEDGQGVVLAQHALAQIYAPLVPIQGDLLRADPMLLTMRLADCWSPRKGDGEEGTLIAGRLTVSPYGFDAEERIEAAIAAWQAKQAGVTLARFGALFHGAAAADRARREIAWVSGVSILGVVALFLTLFGRLRAALLALITMAVGSLGGLAACLALFTHVHALALVFGAAMSGIAADYAIHVMAAGLGARGPAIGNPARAVARPLLVSLLTTLAGFACLLLSGIAVMQQIAVFGGVAIVFAFGFCRFVLGSWYRRPEQIASPARALASMARSMLGWTVRPMILAIAALVAVSFAGFGIQRLVGSDDVRSFQPVPAELAAEEEVVAAAAGYRIDPRFALVRAQGLEALRAAEEVAIAGSLQPLAAPAWLDPSNEQRAADRALIQQHLLEPELAPIAALLDLDPTTLYQPSPSDEVLPAPFGAMRGRVGRTDFSILPLLAEDAQRLEGTPVEGVELVDPAAVYTALLERFRHRALEALALALGRVRARGAGDLAPRGSVVPLAPGGACDGLGSRHQWPRRADLLALLGHGAVRGARAQHRLCSLPGDRSEAGK